MNFSTPFYFVLPASSLAFHLRIISLGSVQPVQCFWCSVCSQWAQYKKLPEDGLRKSFSTNWVRNIIWQICLWAQVL